MTSDLTEIAVAELRQYGIKPQVTQTNGGHIEIAWRVVPEKELRRVICAKTASDWRARMNIRAEVRRALRADNVTLKRERETKPAPRHQELTKALSLPQQVIPIPDQLSALRGEVADLTELVIRIAKMVSRIVPAPPKPVEPTSSRSVKIKEYLTLDRWVSLSALARDTGLASKQIKLKLDYLARLGEVTVYQGQAKLNAVKPRPKKPRGRAAQKAKAKAASRRSLNGKSQHREA
jgi:hypothetical protein